jgi:hypothetical protein
MIELKYPAGVSGGVFRTVEKATQISAPQKPRRVPDTAVSGKNPNYEIPEDMAQASLSCPSDNSPSVPREFFFSDCVLCD